jgi:pimeloyl-ACP methyl ester carboxylesterase
MAHPSEPQRPAPAGDPPDRVQSANALVESVSPSLSRVKIGSGKISEESINQATRSNTVSDKIDLMNEISIQAPGALLKVRRSGDRQKNRSFILLHGGPGMVGNMGPIGEALVDLGQVIDYDQRGTFKSPSSGPFLVQNHVDDLKYLVEQLALGTECTLIGHSWGAVLGLIFCAQNPSLATKLVLIGSGPLDLDTRNAMADNIDRLLTSSELETLSGLRAILADKSISLEERIEADFEVMKLITPVYQHDRESLNGFNFVRRNLIPSYACANDYSEIRNRGDLELALGSIKTPVVAIHGRSDVIPWEMLFSSLKRTLAQAPQCFEIPDSGHMPWLEKNAQEEFFPVLRSI